MVFGGFGMVLGGVLIGFKHRRHNELILGKRFAELCRCFEGPGTCSATFQVY